MTTRDFIAKYYGVKDGKVRACASVFKDEDGIIYSYGYHYPLVFQVAGMTFINIQGYSVTTSKHIGWAWSAVGYDAIGVKLDDQAKREIPRAYVTDSVKIQEIIRCLQAEAKSYREAMAKKKRKDTDVYRYLNYNLERATMRIYRVLDTVSNVSVLSERS